MSRLTSQKSSTATPSRKKGKNTLLLPTSTMVTILDLLECTYREHPMGDVTNHDPFKVLMGCIISLRTKDEVTIPACERLFALAPTPETFVQLSQAQLETLIYPAGFYKTKAKNMLEIAKIILETHQGQTPDTIEELLTFKGVGRKTANLVVALGHQKPAICVDSHVHRMCNRMGYVQTKTPDETEFVLREKLPITHWQKINHLMVMHGREQCKPISPLCSVCVVGHVCPKVGVVKHR
ncbi:MAG: endonuclease III domain-containing protein [Vampirovibrionales bacterium]